MCKTASISTLRSRCISEGFWVFDFAVKCTYFKNFAVVRRKSSVVFKSCSVSEIEQNTCDLEVDDFPDDNLFCEGIELSQFLDRTTTK